MHMSTSTSTSHMSPEQILQKLFTTEQSPQVNDKSEKKHVRIDLKLVRKISQTQNYRTAVELVLILQRILNTGNKPLSLRELIYKNTSVFRNSFGSSFSGSSLSNYSTPKKERITEERSKESPFQSPLKENQASSRQQSHVFVSDSLGSQQKQVLVQCLYKIKSNLSYTIYENKIYSLITVLSPQQQKKNPNLNQQEIYKKILLSSGLGLDGNKTPKIQEFLTKGYQKLDGKFNTFQNLYTFLAQQVLPLVERKILSISIRSHAEREAFLIKAINFMSEYFLHQFQLEIKINKATLIENRIFVEKLFKENFRTHQSLITRNITNILNQALLCPSNMSIQLPLFRLLKRMYYLWGAMSTNGSSQYIQLKAQSQNIGQFIKYPLLVNLKNISLYCKTIDNEDEIKEPAMFCYKVLNLKEDLYLCNQIETLPEMRFLKESKYFSSKAYAFSQEISKIYDTFDLKFNFWKYYKRVERGQLWTYNVLIEKPNSLLIWQFYLQGYDIGFGIYKVEGFKKHSIEEYNKQVQCKQILKLQKYTVTQSQSHKGFMFLKNGLYRLVFDNSYSSFRGKDLSYSILHLESQG